MKTICVLLDAEGNLCVRVTTNGDLVRRDLARQTGSAHLVWASIAPGGIAPVAIAARLEYNVLPRLSHRVRPGSVAPEIHLTLAWETLVAPALGLLFERFSRRSLRPFRAALGRIRKRGRA